MLAREKVNQLAQNLVSYRTCKKVLELNLWCKEWKTLQDVDQTYLGDHDFILFLNHFHTFLYTLLYTPLIPGLTTKP